MGFWGRWLGRGEPRSEKRAEQAAAAPPLPFPLVAVPGASAIDEWRRLRELWRPEGASPVLLGDREEVERAAEALEGCEEPPEAILEAARALTLEGVLEERRAEAAGDEVEVPLGDWPDPPPGPQATFASDTDLATGRPKPLVYLARIPTPRPWEVPAYLCCGGWNACPEAAAHVAVQRAWHERHGAEVLAVAGDVIECWVARPPGDRAAAEALALEQYLYASDIVEQGTGTVRSLAAQLVAAPAWFFWWD